MDPEVFRPARGRVQVGDGGHVVGGVEVGPAEPTPSVGVGFGERVHRLDVERPSRRSGTGSVVQLCGPTGSPMYTDVEVGGPVRLGMREPEGVAELVGDDVPGSGPHSRSSV